MTSSGRLFIIDPVCALPFGHNVRALVYFRQFLGDIGAFQEVKAFGSNQLSADIASQNHIERFFDFLYAEVLAPPRALTAPFSPNGPLPDDASKLAASFADHLQFLDAYGLTPGDTLFYPSADFYSILALAELAARGRLPGSMRILLRLIGVMEHTCPEWPDAENVMLASLRYLLATHPGARLSAETPVYADFLAAKVGAPVIVTTYPLVDDLKPLPETDRFTVFCGGSARVDKGYLRLNRIAHAVYEHVSWRSVRFVTQTLPKAESQRYVGYTRLLRAHPGVETLDDYLDPDELRRHSVAAHAFLLPYDLATYRFRGSAMLMEAIAFGRPVIAEDGTGYAPQIRYYGLGELCTTDADYAAAIVRLASRPRAAAELQARQARARFEGDTNAAYRRWLA